MTNCMEFVCKVCDEKFERRKLKKVPQYCSHKCYHSTLSERNSGKNNPFYGKKHSEETKKKWSEKRKGIHWNTTNQVNLRGEEHGMWKGDEVGYGALHDWVYRQLGAPKLCETCGLDKDPEWAKRSYFHWANISGNYKRELSDWKRLCFKCHMMLDKCKK